MEKNDFAEISKNLNRQKVLTF